MPADLFERAPESFRKRVMIIVNLILVGQYSCKSADLEARVLPSWSWCVRVDPQLL